MSNEASKDNNIALITPSNKRRHKVQPENFMNELNKETNRALHSKKIFLINNCLWLVPLLIVIVSIVIIDLGITFFVWKNPTILFEQIKTLASWTIAYILGLVTDHIRKMIVK